MLGFNPLLPQFWCVSSRSRRVIVEHFQCFFVERQMALGLHGLVQHGKAQPGSQSAGQPPTVRDASGLCCSWLA